MSAETVSGGSVVAVGVDGKGGVVVKKVGYAQRCRGLSCVKIVSPQIEPRGDAFTFFSSVAASRSTVGSASAFPGAAVLRAATSASAACWWWWYVLRNVVCRSCAAPVEVVALVLDDLEEGRWDQRCAADVLLDAHIPAVDLVVAHRVGPRRRARPRARRPPCTCRGVFI